MSTFLTSEDDENEEGEDDDEKEDEKTTKKKGSSSESSFIGAKTRGKFYCAVNVLSSVWCAVVEVSVDSSSRRHPLEMAQQQHQQQQGNERLRLLRDVMEREVKEKLFVNDDTAPLVVVADAEQRRRGTTSGEEEEKRKWKEELKRLIDRLGERLNDESSSSSFAMDGVMMKTSSMTGTKEDEDVAYVLEERENRSGCFVQTSASKSLDALSLISKRSDEAQRRDGLGIRRRRIWKFCDKNINNNRKSDATWPRCVALVPSHRRSYQTTFLYNGKRRRENVVASE